VLTTRVSVSVFLTYGTTSQVARPHGAGEHVRAGELGGQSLWLATAIGAALASPAPCSRPARRVVRRGGETAAMAERYLRISALSCRRR
jgi:Na+-driven multidrug efflux pump